MHQTGRCGKLSHLPGRDTSTRQHIVIFYSFENLPHILKHRGKTIAHDPCLYFQPEKSPITSYCPKRPCGNNNHSQPLTIPNQIQQYRNITTQYFFTCWSQSRSLIGKDKSYSTGLHAWGVFPQVHVGIAERGDAPRGTAQRPVFLVHPAVAVMKS